MERSLVTENQYFGLLYISAANMHPQIVIILIPIAYT